MTTDTTKGISVLYCKHGEDAHRVATFIFGEDAVSNITKTGGFVVRSTNRAKLTEFEEYLEIHVSADYSVI